MEKYLTFLGTIHWQSWLSKLNWCCSVGCSWISNVSIWQSCTFLDTPHYNTSPSVFENGRRVFNCVKSSWKVGHHRWSVNVRRVWRCVLSCKDNNIICTTCALIAKRFWFSLTTYCHSPLQSLVLNITARNKSNTSTNNIWTFSKHFIPNNHVTMIQWAHLLQLNY